MRLFMSMKFEPTYASEMSPDTHEKWPHQLRLDFFFGLHPLLKAVGFSDQFHNVCVMGETVQ